MGPSIEVRKQLKILHKYFSKIEYKGVNLWPIIFVQFYYMFAEKEGLKKNWNKPSWKTILGHLFLKDKYDVVNPRGKFLSTFFWERREHKKLFESCLSAFNKNELTKMYRKKGLNRFSLSFPSITKLMEIYRKMNHSEIRRILGSKKAFYHFLFYTYHQFKTIEFMKNFIDENHFEAQISFESTYHRSEIILAQLFKKHKKKVFVMQHGIIYDYKKMDGGEIYYKNDVPDYYLIWGEKTKKALKKYIDESRLLIVGNPKYSHIIKGKSPPLKEGILFLSNSSFRKSSDNLLEIVNNFLEKNPSIKIKAKLHPNEEIKSYRNMRKLPNFNLTSDSPSNLMRGADFVIMHNTALALESLSFGIPRFIYKDKDTIYFSRFDDLFSNTEELSELIEEYSKNNNYKKLIKNYEREFKENFFQPRKISIPEHYKKTILDKVDEKII